MKKADTAVKRRCPSCGRKVREDALRSCLICRSTFCYGCGVLGYGREFCSSTCSEYFFHGDPDEELEEE
jgi:hypothetical protein